MRLRPLAGAIQHFKGVAHVDDITRVRTYFKKTVHSLQPLVLVMEMLDQNVFEYASSTAPQLASSAPAELQQLVRTRVRIMHGIISSLQGFHALRLIHGDIKSQNIMLTAGSCKPRLVDLSAAHAIKDGTAATALLIGTPGFTAPEYHQLQRRYMASDVWACMDPLWNLFMPYLSRCGLLRPELAHYQHWGFAGKASQVQMWASGLVQRDIGPAVQLLRQALACGSQAQWQTQHAEQYQQQSAAQDRLMRNEPAELQEHWGVLHPLRELQQRAADSKQYKQAMLGEYFFAAPEAWSAMWPYIRPGTVHQGSDAAAMAEVQGVVGQVLDVLEQMLIVDPSARPSAAQLLEMPLFRHQWVLE